ncbi:MAG: glutaminyl-peptide cyclotransferase [Candidatus Pseudobacter hemicellulosilyticus]|uniref:Glutaminyl-peptide cyclotransferase n=1 Tax=Candidatus Pseudobacter hemicellulosilyticus TaxID=3121375 RepID=A0AAJ6BG65_9BACT|nr:MAG: glutaminyl-peptide cyclotransferase [Pseudobacter sp.]
MKFHLLVPLLLICCIACNSGDEQEAPASPVASTPAIQHSLLNAYPHNTDHFTEGLLIHDGKLFESTGSPSKGDRSIIGYYDLATGKFDTKIELKDPQYFGEGIVFLNNKLYQLTYKNQTGFIYDAKTFKQTGTFKFANKEGWGMTTDGQHLIMSDGTDGLTYLDPADQQPVKTLKVTENGIARDSLNELEYIKGYIYANIWLNNSIVKIDPANGQVIGKADLTALVLRASMKYPEAEALNGIAYDSVNDKLYVTGKNWPEIYQIRLSE